MFRSAPISKFAHYAAARGILLSVTTVVAAVLLVQLFRLSILQNQKYQDRAEDNLYSERRLPSSRGNIYDRDGLAIATNQKTWSILYNPYRVKDAEVAEVLARISALGSPLETPIDTIVNTRPRWTLHRLVRQASREQVLPILENPGAFPGARVVEDFRRVYPLGYQMSLLVGTLGAIPKEEKEKYQRPRYVADDEVGRTGIERAFEDRLAGEPGLERTPNRPLEGESSAPEVLRAATPGAHVYLTIDADLQRRANDLLTGEKGSIVLLECQTGNLLVLASNTTFDPNNRRAITVNGLPPGYLSLAARGLYPPGSTFKTVGAAAALRANIPPADEITCRGKYVPEGTTRPFWCSSRGGHGQTDLWQSLQWSCNCYYYELGARLGADPFVRIGQEFGFAVDTGLELGTLETGQLLGKGKYGVADVMNLSIGQGRMLVTPLQVARSYAGLGNGGTMPMVRLVDAIGADRVSGKLPIRPGVSMNLPSAHLKEIIDGLDRVVNRQSGTAYKAGLSKSWEVVGKTGTAENSTGGNDAWFAGFFPRSAPKYAFAIHIESADGHGGEIAAPIGREMVAAILGDYKAASTPSTAEPAPTPRESEEFP